MLNIFDECIYSIPSPFIVQSMKKVSFHFQTCYHYGLVTVSDGKCRPQMTRLKLCPDLLVLQREEFIFPDDEDGYPVDNKVNNLYHQQINTMFTY